MRSIKLFTLACALTLGLTLGNVNTVCATSLDDLVNQPTQEQPAQQPVQEQPAQQPVQEQPVQDQPVGEPTQGQVQGETNREGAENFMNSIKQATALNEVSPGAQKINSTLQKVASFIVQVVSYFIVAFLVVKIALDLCYICIPFTRNILANGHSGTAKQSNAQGGMMGGSSFGSGGFGNSSFGNSGFGNSSFGNSGFGNSGFGGNSGMGGAQQQGIMGITQWVSDAALNAAATEKANGNTPLKAYAKAMTVELVLVPILLVLAITGVLTDLGFLLGEIISNAIGSIGSML